MPRASVSDVLRVLRIDADEHRVPAAGPAEACDRPGDAAEREGSVLVVALGDGSKLLRAKCRRRVLAHLLDRFGIDAASAPAADCAPW